MVIGNIRTYRSQRQPVELFKMNDTIVIESVIQAMIEGRSDADIGQFGIILRNTFQVIFLTVGFTGNTASFIITMSSKMRAFSYSWYLSLLAVADNMALILRLLQLLNSINLTFNDRLLISFRSVFSCQLIEFIQVYVHQVSYFCVISIAAERAIVTLSLIHI